MASQNSPYIIPNFHSLTEIKASLNSVHHCYGFSSQLDFNGSGIFNNKVIKMNKTAHFHALRPTLPYFMDNTRLECNYAAKNCLIYCQNKHLLLSNTANKIIGLNIKENKVTDSEESHVNSIHVTQNHMYSYDECISCGPFRYRTQNIFHVFDCEEDAKPILELKLYDNKDETEIIAISRNKIRFLRFDENEPQLELLNELKPSDISSVVSEPMFENSDRNRFLKQEILLSFTSGNYITNYDIETNETIWNSSDDSFANKSNKQIGFNWSECHHKMFFYGEHERILLVDTRGRKNFVELYCKGGNNLFDWEMFYAICPNRLNDNQLYIASDYHIFLTDIRYPKTNLIQLNHMLPKTVIRGLKSLVIENSDNSKTEILVSSNFHRNCLMSFKSDATLQPTSLHLPLHLSTPKDIDKMFENYFLRGLQIMPFEDNLGFSIALLTNFGDIFMQDFYYDCDEDEDNSDENYDKSFSAGIGSSNLVLDEKTIEYMNYINDFMCRFNFQKEVEGIETNKCLSCSINRNCELRANICQCNDAYALDNRSNGESDEESVISTDNTTDIYNKHIGQEVMQIKNKINNLEEFSKISNDYTKKIYNLWENVI